MTQNNYAIILLLVINVILVVFFGLILSFFLYRLTRLKKNGITGGLVFFSGGLFFNQSMGLRSVAIIHFGLGGYSPVFVPLSEIFLQIIGHGVLLLACSAMIFVLYQEATLPRKRKINPIVSRAMDSMSNITRPTRPRLDTDVYKNGGDNA